MIRTLLFATLAICLPVSAGAEEAPRPKSIWAAGNPGWVKPVDPFRIAGNVHFVGTEGLGIFLITGEDGHILIDGGLPGFEDQVLDSIRALGFDPADVKVLLNTHAHFDHSGGLAYLKEVTGAEFWAMSEDVAQLEGGFYVGAEDNAAFNAPPVKVDRVLTDGEEIHLGNITLTARLTAGHSPGCTSWWTSIEEGGEALDLLIFCSATVAANRLVPPQYEGIVEDYRKTFRVTKDWQPDIFVANHPGFSNLMAERLKAEAGEPEAYRNTELFTRMMARLEDEFEKALKNQTAEAGQ